MVCVICIPLNKTMKATLRFDVVKATVQVANLELLQSKVKRYLRYPVNGEWLE